MAASSSKRRLCLIDGSSYFYRAFFAVRPLTTSKGLHVNAIYGFTTMIMKVLKDLKPDYVSIIFDSKEETFRHEIYEDYKANRDEMPDDLVEQIPYIKSVVDAFNIHSLEKDGYEADDLIGTVCERFKDKDVDIFIVSSDKDLMQLVGKKVKMFDTMRDKLIGVPQVKEKFGVAPDRVIDVLALMGDSSDNVPGVYGVGPKTASHLIQTYGSLDAVLKSTEKLKGKLKERLENEKDKALLSLKLVTLDRDVPIPFKLDEFKTAEIDKARATALFRELEFTRLMTQLGLKDDSADVLRSSSIKRTYKTILTEAAFKDVLQKLKKSDHFVIDLETTSLEPLEAEIVGVALSYPVSKKYEVCYIPVLHQGVKQLASKEVLSKLKVLLEDSKIRKWGQNIKYDALILKNHEIHVTNISDDSMIASYILNPSERHGLDRMALKHLNHDTIKYSDVTKQGKKQIGFDEVPIDRATEYAGEDADVTQRLVTLLRKRLKKEKRLKLYEEIEMPLVSILLQMEFDGVKIDRSFLKKMSIDLNKILTTTEKKIYELAGEEFNVRSTKQLATILFEKLKLPSKKRTKTGHSTNEEVLKALSENHPLPKEILAYREAAKLKSTYVDALLEWADSKTDRVHTSYNQTIAATGRLSSSNPNLQNIPIRSDWGQKIREAFISERGSVLLSADYSQVELRLLAHLSKDVVLSEAFKLDKDIHQLTASEVFGVFPEMVTDEMRRMAKAINFGLIYGLSAFGLSQQLKISRTKAQEYIDRYFSRYKKVKEYIKKTIDDAYDAGYVETMTGRRRYLPEIQSSNPRLRQLAERMAINTPIQGSSADLIKIAMINIAKAFKKKRLTSKMILQVHDELVFEVPKAEVKEVSIIVTKEMEGAMKLSVPVKISLNTGKNWGEAH